MVNKWEDELCTDRKNNNFECDVILVAPLVSYHPLHARFGHRELKLVILPVRLHKIQHRCFISVSRENKTHIEKTRLKTAINITVLFRSIKMIIFVILLVICELIVSLNGQTLESK